MNNWTKIISLSLVLGFFPGASIASWEEGDHWLGKAVHFLKSAGHIGKGFVTSVYTHHTDELAFVKTSKGLVIKSIPVETNMIREVFEGSVSGGKNLYTEGEKLYRKGVKQSIKEGTQYIRENKLLTTRTVASALSFIDPYGVSKFVSPVLMAGRDMVEYLPKIGRLPISSWQKISKAGAFIFVVSLPTAAMAYDSLLQAQGAYFGGSDCYGKELTLTRNFRECVKGGEDFGTCYFGAPRSEGVEYDGYAFQMHETEGNPSLAPVSVTNYDENELCIVSATDPNGFATKTCFNNRDFSGEITVVQTTMPFSEAHKGLEVGTIAYHGAVEIDNRGKCGFFTNLTATKVNPGEGTVCVISDFELPQQMCVSPGGVVTVRGLTAEEYSSINPDPSSSFIVIRDPGTVGIDVRPDTIENRNDWQTCSLEDSPIIDVANTTSPNPDFEEEVWFDAQEEFDSVPESETPLITEAPCVPTISFWDAVKAYWYQNLDHFQATC